MTKALASPRRPASVPASGSRTEAKRSSILTAARTLFLQHGFLGTSMDDVAAAARVSKQTVYKHFGDKRRLFVELLTADMGGAEQTVAELGHLVPASDDLPRDLRAYARAYLSAIMQPDLLRLRRVVIGEAERFPDLAAAWYEQGPLQAYQRFGGWFRVLHERGLLDIPDADMAAQHFNWLILAAPLNEAMAAPTARPPDASVLHRYADEGVRVFLAAYSPSTAGHA